MRLLSALVLLILYSLLSSLLIIPSSQQELRDEVMELQSEMQSIGAEIDDLRHDVSVVLFKFLVELTEMEEDEARSWMAINLSSQGSWE